MYSFDNDEEWVLCYKTQDLFVTLIGYILICAVTFRRFFFPTKVIYFDGVFKQMTTIKTTTNNSDHKTY